VGVACLPPATIQPSGLVTGGVAAVGVACLPPATIQPSGLVTGGVAVGVVFPAGPQLIYECARLVGCYL
jgi:hypothetical protein